MSRRKVSTRRASAQKPGRKGGGEGWIYGRHAVAAALANPARRCRRLLLSAAQHPLADHPLAEVGAAESIQAVLPAGAVHQGMALQVDPLPPVGLDEICPSGDDPGLRIVVLDQVTDPQNVGAVLRCCAALGAAALVVQDRHAPPVTGVLAKAASGALEHVPLVYETNLSRSLDKLGEAGFWRLGLDGDADRTIGDARPHGPLALVLGAEGRGLRRLTAESCDELARIPISDSIDSLNVANAAAIALYALGVGG